MAFLKGAFWGVVIGGAGAAVVSVVAPPPSGALPPLPPVTVLPDVPPGPAAETPATPDLSDVAVVDAPGGAPQTSALGAPEDAMPTPQTDGDTSRPQAMDTALDEPAAPAVPATPLDAPPAPDVQVLPNPQSLAPQVPASESDIVVDAAPDAPVEVLTPTPDPSGDAPSDMQVDATIDTTDDAAPADAATVVVIETPVPDAGSADAVAPTDSATPAAPDAGVPDAGPPVAPAPDTAMSDGPATPETPAAPVAPDAADRPAVVAIIDTPARGLPGGDSGVVVRRSGALPEAEAAPDPVPAPAPEADADAPALDRYAAFFANAADLPLMSIVLRDDGSMPGAAQAVGDLPFPVTILLDPTRPGASERMDAYAAAGIEVAALAALPPGGNATDAAVALEGTFDAVPRAVALVAADAAGLPGGAAVLDQVVGSLARDGRGLLVSDQGLNSGLRAAEAADVPAATIYRDLDDNDQDARVIRRFVDQAAFRARQQPGVVLLGRVRPETVSAPMLWGQANRAGPVSLAPLSATLKAE